MHKTAIGNLYSLAERYLRIQPYGPVFTLFKDGNFEASVLLLDTVWDISFAKHVKEEFVAAVPARDVLAFGDSSSPAAVAELRAIIDRLTSSAVGQRKSPQVRFYCDARFEVDRGEMLNVIGVMA